MPHTSVRFGWFAASASPPLKPPRCPTMNTAANTAAIPRLVTYANNNPMVANQPGGRAFNVSNICRARCASILFVAIFGRDFFTSAMMACEVSVGIVWSSGEASGTPRFRNAAVVRAIRYAAGTPTNMKMPRYIRTLSPEYIPPTTSATTAKTRKVASNSGCRQKNSACTIHPPSSGNTGSRLMPFKMSITSAI